MVNPPLLTFNYAQFIAQCPAYSNATAYPEATLAAYWTSATFYMSDVGNFGVVQGAARQYGINNMLAHLVFIAGLVAAGQVPGLMQTATIDKVSVGLTPPPLKSQWQWWLSLSPYGQQVLAQMQGASVGGFFVAGPYGGIQGYLPAYGYGWGGSL